MIRLVALVLQLTLVAFSNCHSLLVNPPPRSDSISNSTTIPCGEGKRQTHSLPEISPGLYLVQWKELKCHPETPFRISLNVHGKDEGFGFHEHILFDHIPHNSDCVKDESKEVTYSINVLIPDIKCDHCTLQLAQILTDKPIKHCPGTYPDHWKSYYSCSDITITGKGEISEYEHKVQDTFNTGPYGEESATYLENGQIYIPSIRYAQVESSEHCSQFKHICDSDFDHYSGSEPSFCFKWHFDSDDTISFTIETTAAGWFAIGFSNSGGMQDSDIYMGFVDKETGISSFSDMHIPNVKNQRLPVLDQNQDILSFVGLHVNQGEMIKNKRITLATFVRKLNTNDPNDMEFVNQKPVKIIFGYHTSESNFAVAHDYHSAHSLLVDLFNEDSPIVKKDRTTLHGSLMFISWSVLSPFAIIFARFMKDKRYWFILHLSFQFLACIICWSSFSVIYSDVSHIHGQHYTSLHAKIGVLLFAASILQPLLGLTSHLLFRSKKISEFKKGAIAKSHQYLGRLAVILSFINIFLGLNHASAKMGYYLVAGSWLFILATLFFFLENKRRKSKSSRFDPGSQIAEDQQEDDEDELL